MRLKYLSTILLCGGLYSLQAQTTDSTRNGRYWGIQANQLMRQLINFGNNAGAVGNPYLLTYASNSVKTGMGFTMGIGYSFNQFNDGDAITKRTTRNGDFSVRVGIEKKSFWTKHWMTSFSVDVLLDRNKSETKTSSNIGGGGVENVTTKSVTTMGGFGPRFALNYVISQRIIVGTEASYYFKSGKEKISGGPQPTVENQNKSFNLAVPSVIYLILRY